MAKFNKDNAAIFGAKGGKISKRKSQDKRVQEFLENELTKINAKGKVIPLGTNREELLYQALFKSGLKGKTEASRELFDRAYGKARQSMDLRAGLDDDYRELIAEINKNKDLVPKEVPDLSTASKEKEFDFSAVNKKDKKKITLSNKKKKTKTKKKITLSSKSKKPIEKKKITLKNNKKK